jgi:predicted ribosomally synthesized peptide with nif11-like leader
MSKENATNFLKTAATDTALRGKFKVVANPEEFLKIASSLGYFFTTEQLLAVVKEYSESVPLRRKTGVWQWLRSLNWIEKAQPGEMLAQKVVTSQAELNQALASQHGSNKKPGEILLEFETQYRDAIDETLNQLQTTVLLVAHLEARITKIGQDLQNLSQKVEEFVTQQKAE